MARFGHAVHYPARAPASSPAASCRHALIVLDISMAIVIGPTPPGTGVMAAHLGATDAKSTSPTSRYPRVAAGSRDLVDAHVDDDRALAHVLTRDESRLANRHHQRYPPPQNLPQIARAAVRDGHGGIAAPALAHHQQRERFSHEQTAARA